MSERFNRTNEGPFSLDLIDIPQPAAGTDFSVTLEERYTYSIFSVSFTNTTSATVLNRLIHLHFFLGDRLLVIRPHTFAQSASKTFFYNFVNGGVDVNLGSALNIVTFELPSGIIFPGGTRILSSSAPVDGTDQISNIFLYVQKWPVLDT